jgi:hypothetical protein
MEPFPAPSPHAASGLAKEVHALVARYPNLNPEETDRLIEIYRNLPMLQIALMASDEHLAPNLASFQRNHRGRIRTPFRQYSVFLIPVAILAIVVIRTVLG